MRNRVFILSIPGPADMGDVNGLKMINDSFGHATGDKLLKKPQK